MLATGGLKVGPVGADLQLCTLLKNIIIEWLRVTAIANPALEQKNDKCQLASWYSGSKERTQLCRRGAFRLAGCSEGGVQGCRPLTPPHALIMSRISFSV